MRGASISDLTDAMGINRPSLYAAFGGKEELFRKALDLYLKRVGEWMSAALSQPTARAVVEQLLRTAAERSGMKGRQKACLLVGGALTCGESARPIQRELAMRRETTVKMLKARFQRAVDEGDLKPRTDAGYLGAICRGVAGRDGGSNRRGSQSTGIARNRRYGHVRLDLGSQVTSARLGGGLGLDLRGLEDTIFDRAGVAQLAEHHVPNVNVEGSSPFARSECKSCRTLSFSVPVRCRAARPKMPGDSVVYGFPLRSVPYALPKSSTQVLPPSGQAIVTLEGRDFYLGAYGTAASKAEYDRRIVEWISAGRRVPIDQNAVTVAEVVAAIRKHAKNYYREADGTVNKSARLQLDLTWDYGVRLPGQCSLKIE